MAAGQEGQVPRALLLFYEEVYLGDAELFTLFYFVSMAYYQA